MKFFVLGKRKQKTAIKPGSVEISLWVAWELKKKEKNQCSEYKERLQ